MGGGGNGAVQLTHPSQWSFPASTQEETRERGAPNSTPKEWGVASLGDNMEYSTWHPYRAQGHGAFQQHNTEGWTIPPPHGGREMELPIQHPYMPHGNGTLHCVCISAPGWGRGALHQSAASFWAGASVPCKTSLIATHKRMVGQVGGREHADWLVAQLAFRMQHKNKH